jgi:hypothetical protein
MVFHDIDLIQFLFKRVSIEYMYIVYIIARRYCLLTNHCILILDVRSTDILL